MPGKGLRNMAWMQRALDETKERCRRVKLKIIIAVNKYKFKKNGGRKFVASSDFLPWLCSCGAQPLLLPAFCLLCGAGQEELLCDGRNRSVGEPARRN